MNWKKLERRAKQLAPFAIVLFGFAMRVFAIDSTWVDGDRANPHGIGLLIVDALSHGKFTPFLLFNDDASTTLPMPPLIGYVWALVSLFDRSLFTATAFGMIANALVVPAAYAIGKRIANWQTGMFAATLAAGSGWAVYLARGMWHPGHLEVTVALGAWLLVDGITRQKPRALLGGFGFVAATALSYFGALVMPFQAFFATLAAGAWRGRLRKAWLMGLAVCAAAFLFYGGSLVAMGRLTPDYIAKISLFKAESGVQTEADLQARDITPMNRDPIGHFARLASNAAYALTWTNQSAQNYAARLPLSDALSAALGIFIALGMARLAWGFRKPANRFLLVWAGLPILALLAIAALKKDFLVAIYYLLLTSPVQYVAGGLGLSLLFSAPVAQSGRSAKNISSGLTLLLCAALSIIPAWNFGAAAETVYTQAFIAPDFMPLKWSLQLGKMWQRECKTLDGSNFWWDLSLFQDPQRWRWGGVRANEFSSMWSVKPEGGTCALSQKGAPLAHAELLPLQVVDGSTLRTYRSYPIGQSQPPTLTMNIGWSLLDFSAPTAARAGETISVQHIWRVDALPTEPHAAWYYAPFIKLIGPDGKTVLDVDRAVSLEGSQWAQGEALVSNVQLQLPAGLAPGAYTIRASVFDPNQKKNAAYFDATQNGKVILELEQKVTITNY
ncbi:MAG TPA: glycosyltransferase family 39 protein [Thermoflexales bacterium]|nr:glycosyltransferase family 39 protein [Thermoflexales bacterium]HQW36695.1 glycosyltransferase family 39 protein [Thermoflexales bacterium]HQX74812.1 glycosyltransferase family 39 protein [Thermoflexales bacterium]HRA00564.1 glycosyltransferase family 39 protein [Thermoflexales bacterium]